MARRRRRFGLLRSAKASHRVGEADQRLSDGQQCIGLGMPVQARSLGAVPIAGIAAGVHLISDASALLGVGKGLFGAHGHRRPAMSRIFPLKVGLNALPRG
jgi:hypothetical protein